jgi:hypothetical protein
MSNVFGGPLRALLMDQVKVVQGRLLLGSQFEQNGRCRELVGRSNGIVARGSMMSPEPYLSNS